MKYFSLFLDVIFSALIMFILSFVIINYYIELKFAITFAIILSVPVAIIAYKRITEKRKSDSDKKAEQIKIEQLNAELSLYTQTELNDLFYKALSKGSFNPNRKNGAIYINNKDVILVRYGETGARKADVVKAFNLSLPNGKAYLIAQSFQKELLSFIERFGGTVIPVDDKKTYKFLEGLNCLPTPKIPALPTKQTKKRIKLAFFHRKKSKSYFMFGLVFLLMSFIVPIKLYYIIVGCIFLTISLSLKIFGATD